VPKRLDASTSRPALERCLGGDTDRIVRQVNAPRVNPEQLLLVLLVPVLVILQVILQKVPLGEAIFFVILVFIGHRGGASLSAGYPPYLPQAFTLAARC